MTDAIKQAFGDPIHVSKAKEMADAIIKDFPLPLHAEIVETFKNRIIATHNSNVEKIKKS